MTQITKKQQQHTGSRARIIGMIQMILVILAGSMCGFLVAAIHAVQFHVWNGVQGGSSSTLRSDTDDTTACRLPDNAIKIPIRTNENAFELAVWNDGDFLTESILKSGFWEILEVTGLAELGDTNLPEDEKVFWDIGANVGYYSFLFAAAGYDVLAVEPEHQNAALFRASLCLNPELGKRIQLIQKAVSSDINKNKAFCKMIATAKAKRMKQYLHLIPRLSCDETLKCRGHNICQDTKVTTLDELLQQQKSKPPSVLKLDVEGHEYAVLQGASQSVLAHASSPPKLIQYENKDPRVEADISALLEGFGYTIGQERGHDSNTVAVHKSNLG